MVYKVIFIGNKESDDIPLSLTFQHLNADKFIQVPPQFLSSLKALSSQHSNIIYFQNIDEVVKSEDLLTNLTFNYYIVILFSQNSSDQKEGYLIGNLKKRGDLIIGYWPFNFNPAKIEPEPVHDKLRDLIENSGSYLEIALIYSV